MILNKSVLSLFEDILILYFSEPNASKTKFIQEEIEVDRAIPTTPRKLNKRIAKIKFRAIEIRL